MSAIFLPRKWRHQPQGAVEIDQNHPIGRKVLWAYTPWMGLTSITPGTVRGITASPNNATVVTKAGRNGAGVEVRSTGSYSGVGLNIANTETLAGFSTSGAFYFLVDGLRYANSNTCGLVRLQSPNRLRVTSDSSGRKLEFYISSNSRLTGSVSIPDGYTGGIGISAETRSAVSTYIGQQIGIDRGSLGTFNLGGPDGIRSVTDDYPNWICPLFVRTDYLSHDEMRALDEAPFTVFRAPSHRIWFDVGGGAPAAELDADAQASAQASGTLTTAIALAGASIVATTSTGSLSTGIRLGGSAATLTQAQGTLTAQIRLQSSALAGAIASAGLTTAIRIAADAQAGASATGDLTVGNSIDLTGNAQAAALAAGSITTIIRFEAGAVAKVLGAGTLTAPGAPSQLVADATVIAIAEGGLTTAIQLHGAAASVVQASGTLDVALTFEAAAFASAMAAGVLSTQVRMEAAAVASALARADLTGGMPVVPPAERTIPVRAQNRVIPVRAQTRLIPA